MFGATSPSQDRFRWVKVKGSCDKELIEAGNVGAGCGWSEESRIFLVLGDHDCEKDGARE